MGGFGRGMGGFAAPRAMGSFGSGGFAGIGSSRLGSSPLAGSGRFAQGFTPMSSGNGWGSWSSNCGQPLGCATTGSLGWNQGFWDGTALSVNGSWHSDHWRIHFHLGAPVPAHCAAPVGCAAPCYSPYYGGWVYRCGYPYYTGLYGYPYGSYYVYPSYMQDAFPVMQQPMMQPPAPEPPAQAQQPPTDIEAALHDLQAGQFDAAITRLRRHLKTHLDDASAMRMLAVAMLEAKHFDDAVAMLRQAYRTEPQLSLDPIDAGQLGMDGTELRRQVSSAVLFAHRANSGSAWLTVAVLMQAEGRAQLAASMLTRAEKQGLEAEILTSMKAALQHP
jgi:hypothetical protein